MSHTWPVKTLFIGRSIVHTDTGEIAVNYGRQKFEKNPLPSYTLNLSTRGAVTVCGVCGLQAGWCWILRGRAAKGTSVRRRGVGSAMPTGSDRTAVSPASITSAWRC